MNDQKNRRDLSAKIAGKIRADLEDGGFYTRDSLTDRDVHFLAYEYATQWDAWAETFPHSAAEYRASRALLAALDACVAGEAVQDLAVTVTPAWATKLLELAAAQQEAAVACAMAEEAYDKEYKEYEKVRVARNEARELVQQKSRELRAATTALAILTAAT